VIATNTTISREGLKSDNKTEMGLSGKPWQTFYRGDPIFHRKNKAFPSSVGGIHSAEDAIEKLDAGASLVQLYTFFYYEGPGEIH
jgi:dihydroorotate dehydrogenase